MLTALRQAAGSLPAKILFGALVASFAVWGIGDVFNNSGRDETVVKVGDSEISSRFFAENFRRQMNTLRQLNISEEDARKLGLHARLMDNLISQRLYDLQARDLGVFVSDSALSVEIKSQAIFLDEFGQFDRGRFQSALLRDGRSESAFVDDLRREIQREQVIDSLVPGIPPPPPLANKINQRRGERRVAKYVKILVKPARILEPSEGELDTYHKANSDRFTSPESRVVSYLHFTSQDFVNEIIVSEQDLRETYQDRASELAIPERRNILQLPLDDEASAMSALARISSGESFVNVAMELAGGNDISLGIVSRDELPVEFAEAAFSLAVGESSKPLQSPFGWHVIHVATIELGSIPSFEQLRVELKKTIVEEAAIDVMYSIANQLEDALGGGANLEEAASNLNLYVSRIDSLDQNGHDTDGLQIKGLPDGRRFVETVFNIEVGEESTLIETEEGGYLIVRVDSSRSPLLRPLASIHEEVVSAWQFEKAQEAVFEQAKRLIEELNLGKTLGIEPGHQIFSVVTSDPFTRNGNGVGDALPLSIVGDLFERTLGGAAMAQTNGGAVVAQLADIQSANTAEQSAQIELAVRLRSEYSTDMLEQLRAELQQRYGVTVNESAVDALY